MVNPGVASATNGYRLRILNEASGGFWDFSLWRVDNSVGTQLGTTVAAVTSVGDQICLRFLGTTIYGVKATSGVETTILVRPEATYTAAGNLGIRTNDAVIVLDDFGGGTLPDPSPPSLIVVAGNRW